MTVAAYLVSRVMAYAEVAGLLAILDCEVLEPTGFIDRIGKDRVYMTPTAVSVFQEGYAARHVRRP